MLTQQQVSLRGCNALIVHSIFLRHCWNTWRQTACKSIRCFHIVSQILNISWWKAHWVRTPEKRRQSRKNVQKNGILKLINFYGCVSKNVRRRQNSSAILHKIDELWFLGGGLIVLSVEHLSPCRIKIKPFRVHQYLLCRKHRWCPCLSLFRVHLSEQWAQRKPQMNGSRSLFDGALDRAASTSMFTPKPPASWRPKGSGDTFEMFRIWFCVKETLWQSGA